jgi:3'-5' exoribonuclease
MTSLLSISELKKTARIHSSVEAELHAQIERLTRKDASNGKPFYEVVLRDATESMTLRAWTDTGAFETCGSLQNGDFVAVIGCFQNNGSFGLDARGWELRELPNEEIEVLLEGTSERRALLERAYEKITEAVASIVDPRIKALCDQFLSQYGPRFRRAAAARGNHHARRGGLLEHTSRMMECALALCGVYPEINRDLMTAGVLFHDTGKLWETCPPEKGFGIEPELRGELLGHLSIGIELVNTLWRDLQKEGWEMLTPSSDDVRLHLLHLIAAHHGQLEFGSPILPKTPEAAMLHFIDNIDARMEMFFTSYEASSQNAGGRSGTMEWVRPLGVAPVTPLPACLPSPSEPIIEDLFFSLAKTPAKK